MNTDDLSTMYTAHGATVRRYIRRHVANPEDAADIAAGVWERTARAVLSNPELQIQPGWVITCARNAVVDYRRRRSHVELCDMPLHMAGHHNTAHTAINRVTVAHLLRLLSPTRRRVLVLRYLCDLTVEEVAEALNMSPGSVKSATHNACHDLRVKVGAAPVPPPRNNRRKCSQ